MLWKGRRQSMNVVDRRGMGGPVGLGTLIIGALVYYFMGGNPSEYVAQKSGSMQRQEMTAESNEQKEFVSVVLADTEDVWQAMFKKYGITYKEPKLVLFSNMVQSACGNASSAVGPFYCPGDQQVYLDLTFFNQLSRDLGAEGDFATAYVIAHEIGHHVQNLLGVESDIRRRQKTANEKERNRLSVQMELQADCLAGVWAKQTKSSKNVIEEGDIEEAMKAASAVGDDRLQQASQGQVVPDSFTHGTSEQRVQAFKTGFASGTVTGCNR